MDMNAHLYCVYIYIFIEREREHAVDLCTRLVVFHWLCLHELFIVAFWSSWFQVLGHCRVSMFLRFDFCQLYSNV